MDEMDKILITNLEKDARMSLKKLAQEMDLKTSTLYHRLHKLSESKIILNFSVIVNPEKIGISDFYKLNLKLSLPDDPISRKLAENLAEKLSDGLKEVFFSAMGENNTLYMIVAFFDEEHKREFLQTLSSNELVKNIEKVKLQFIHKGLRMFDFNEDKLLERINSSKKKSHKKNKKFESNETEKILNVNSRKIGTVSSYNSNDDTEDNDEMIQL